MTDVRIEAGDLVTCKPVAWWAPEGEKVGVGVVVSVRPTVVGWVEVLWPDGPCVMPGHDLKLVTK